jgi:CheY-like chemotaxis protein
MADTITALAALLWPLMFLVLLLVVRRPLVAVVRSAEQREWTLEVGGQKINMGQLSDQQNVAIADLQAQISALHQRITEVGGTEGAEVRPGWEQLPVDDSRADTVPNSVLWVDDYPSNNALIVEQLQRNGIRVDIALSTAEGLAKLGERRYGAVLSDMGRYENDTSVSDAGITLLRAVRETHPTVPFLIYCGARAAAHFRDEALSAGADVITASPTELSDRLRSLGLL